MSEDIKDNVAFEIYQMSKKYDNLNIDLICATITHESALSWNPKVISRAGALGLMQIMPTTGAFLAESEGIEWTTSEEVLFDPIKNIQLGCKYLSNLVEMFDVEGGLAAYNGGARRAAKWLANNRDYKVLYKETRGYIPAIMKLYERFKELDYVM
jgi:soluble lytic murein transglycosylase